MRCIFPVTSFVLLLTLSITIANAADNAASPIFTESFDQGADRWEFADPSAWSIEKTGEGKVFSLNKKKSNYQPPVRSPHNMALLKEVEVTDFEMRVRLKSTEPDYGHRSLCLFFGYQDPSHFYYVHFGKKMDDHANQIFIVNDSPRKKISTKTTQGTPWDDAWHDVKITRDATSGEIAIYFDDMKTPIMTAHDKTFAWGRVGVGSFDDRGQFDDLELFGNKR